METATQTFRSGHASDADWETLTASCLTQIGNIPAGANLGFVYVSDTLDEDLPLLIADRLREDTGVDHWVGTVGFGVMVGGREYFDTPAMVVLVGALDEDAFRVMSTIDTPGDPLPDEVMDWVARRNPMLGVVHADPRNAYVGDILNSITDDTEAFLVGADRIPGQAGPDRGRADGGWRVRRSIRRRRRRDHWVKPGLFAGRRDYEVTKAKDNILFELDGKPALDVFKEDIGDVLARNLERVGGYIHAALPISGDDSGDYLVRNVVGVDPDNKLVAIGERISAGDRVMFVRRDGPSAMEDLHRMLADVISRSNGTPKAALYYSCVARGPNLFGPDSEELKAVQGALGDEVPVVGFFANGEISKNRLYGYTGVLTLIG